MAAEIEEDTKKKIIVLVAQMMTMIQTVSSSYAIAFKQQMDHSAVLPLLLAQPCDFRRDRRVWTRSRVQSSHESSLIVSYSDNMFKRKMRISKATFSYICSKVAPTFGKQDTRFRRAIPLDKRVSMALERFTTGNRLSAIAARHGVGISTLQKIVIDFAHSIRTYLHDFCVKWPTGERMQRWVLEFQRLRGVPGVVGAIDITHIPIIAPRESPQDHMNAKGFHSILLQLVVSPNNMVWDYDVGWPGSIPDWEVLSKTRLGHKCENGELEEHCLAGDAEYPPKSWLLSPFKAYSGQLSPQQYHWNYTLAATRIPVERTIAMIKSRFRILLQRNDILLQNTTDMVSTCVVLHNLCMLHGDAVDELWVDEAETAMRLASEVEEPSNPQQEMDMKAAAYGLDQLRGLTVTEEEAMERASRTNGITLLLENGGSADNQGLFAESTSSLKRKREVQGWFAAPPGSSSGSSS